MVSEWWKEGSLRGDQTTTVIPGIVAAAWRQEA